MSVTKVTCPDCGGVSNLVSVRRALCPYCGTELKLPDPEPDPDFGELIAPAPQLEQPLKPAEPVYTDEELFTAERKRRRWHLLNGILLGVLLLPWIFCRVPKFPLPDECLFVIWLLLLAVCTLISARLRPEDAFLEKEPFIPNKLVHGILFLLCSGILTYIIGALINS